MSKMTPFDHVKKIYTSGATFTTDEGYVQYIINKELSKNPGLIELVNYVQQFQLSNKLHFKILNEFASNTSPPKYNQFPWIWTKSSKEDDTINALAKHLEIGIEEARDNYKILLLTEEGKDYILYIQRSYGLKNNKGKRI